MLQQMLQSMRTFARSGVDGVDLDLILELGGRRKGTTEADLTAADIRSRLAYSAADTKSVALSNDGCSGWLSKLGSDSNWTRRSVPYL
jgi:hypothetical protein